MDGGHGWFHTLRRGGCQAPCLRVFPLVTALHCLPLACGRRGSLREDDPLSCRSRVYFLRGCTLVVTLWMGLVCVPEGCVEWDIQGLS